MVGAATTGLPLMLFGDTPDDVEIPLGLTARVVRMYARGVGPTFRSPSLLLLAEVSATFTCGSRGRVVVVGTFARMVGVRPAVEGVALVATRGVSGAPVRLAAKVGSVGLPGGGRPWALRSDDIPGLRGYRGEYIEGWSGRAEHLRVLLRFRERRIGCIQRTVARGIVAFVKKKDPGRV